MGSVDNIDVVTTEVGAPVLMLGWVNPVFERGRRIP